MYYRDIESNPKAAAQHNRNQLLNAKERLKRNAAGRKAKKLGKLA